MELIHTRYGIADATLRSIFDVEQLKSLNLVRLLNLQDVPIASMNKKTGEYTINMSYHSYKTVSEKRTIYYYARCYLVVTKNGSAVKLELFNGFYYRPDKPYFLGRLEIKAPLKRATTYYGKLKAIFYAGESDRVDYFKATTKNVRINDHTDRPLVEITQEGGYWVLDACKATKKEEGVYFTGRSYLQIVDNENEISFRVFRRDTGHVVAAVTFDKKQEWI